MNRIRQRRERERKRETERELNATEQQHGNRNASVSIVEITVRIPNSCKTMLYNEGKKNTSTQQFDPCEEHGTHRESERENRERNATSHSMWIGSSHMEKTIAMCFEWKRARFCLYQCILSYVTALILALLRILALTHANDKMWTVLMQPCLRFRAIWTDDGEHAMFYALRVTLDVASFDRVTCYFCDGLQNMWLLEHNDSFPVYHHASVRPFRIWIRNWNYSFGNIFPPNEINSNIFIQRKIS